MHVFMLTPLAVSIDCQFANAQTASVQVSMFCDQIQIGYFFNKRLFARPLFEKLFISNDLMLFSP